MKLFFDTETSGKADFKLPPDHPCQPRLVQLAAILTTNDCDEISMVNLLVLPNGFEIGAGATAVHGISTGHALSFGLPVKTAVGMFIRMAWAAETLHAYNADFDRIVMLGEILRLPNTPNPFESKPPMCEMKPMTDLCRLPGRYGSFKWPSLTEAHTHCLGVPFADAHDALGDVRAMIAVHKWRMAKQKGLHLAAAAATT